MNADTKAKNYFCHHCKSLINITTGICTNKSCETITAKKRYWKIGTTIVRSKNPLTYKEAQDKILEKLLKNL